MEFNFMYLVVIFIISVLIFQIDLRKGVYAVSTWILLMMIFMVVYNYKNGETTSIVPIYFYIPMTIICFLLAIKSRKIIGYERYKFNKFNIAGYLILWIFVLYVNKDMSCPLFIKILFLGLLAGLLYLMIQGALNGFIFTWITYFFGKEETYTGDITLRKIRTQKFVNYHMKIQGVDKDFDPNYKIVKEHLKNTSSCTLKDGTIVMKKSLVFKRAIIIKISFN